MIKIAFVIDTIESPTAGTEKQLLMLIKHLDRTRFQPFLCVLRGSDWLDQQFDLCPLFVAELFSFKGVSGIRGIRDLSNYFIKEAISIVQVHFRDSSVAGILAAKMAKVKTIVATRRNQGYWYTPLELKLQKFLNRWVTIFIANSESTKQWTIQTEGLNPEKVIVIYNGLDLDEFYCGTNDQRSAFRDLLGFPKESIIIGIIANLRPVKSVDVFLTVVQIVLREISTARFVVIGDGPERDSLEKLADDLEIKGSGLFLGSRVDVPDILACIDIGVLSSKSESFSNAIIEYMASGVPVFSMDVGGAREALGDQAGVIFEQGDFIGMGKRIVEYVSSEPLTTFGCVGFDRSRDLFSRGMMICKYEKLCIGLSE